MAPVIFNFLGRQVGSTLAGFMVALESDTQLQKQCRCSSYENLDQHRPPAAEEILLTPSEDGTMSVSLKRVESQG